MLAPQIRLLSLDGGGVRGLSALAILKQLVCSINPESPPLPCDLFDMMGGTSTGGLIAIMLGRLRMSVDECMTVYAQLSDRVFTKKRHRIRGLTGQIQGRFDSDELTACIKEVLVTRGLDPDALLKDELEGACKVFVCATSAQTRSIVHLRSYRSPRGRENLYRTTKIWEACRATSAASSFFDPITIGEYGETFVDGGTGANNPISHVWNEAKDVWTLDRIEDHLHCLISVGTGLPSIKPFGSSLVKISATLRAISLETESTAENFVRDKSGLETAGKYYRFNVVRGLEGIGLEDSSEMPKIIAATDRYIESQAVYKLLQQCSFVLQAFAFLPQNLSSTISAVRDMSIGELSSSEPQKREIPTKGHVSLGRDSTPIHNACRSADVVAVRRLLRTPMILVDLQKDDGEGMKPLHYAAAAGSAPICAALLSAGASGVAQDFRGWTAAHYAAQGGNTAIMKCLADQFADLKTPDDVGDTPCHIASAAGEIEIVAFLLMDRNHAPGMNAGSPSFKNDKGMTAAQVAREHGHSDVAKLLDSGIDLNVHSTTVLHWAAETGTTRLLRSFMTENEIIKPNDEAMTPIALAAKHGHSEACEMLLDVGSDIESKQADGQTPLHLASIAGHADIVTFLLDRGASIESRCFHDNTPLLAATRSARFLVMDRLLERGASPEARGRDRLNAMALAVSTKDRRCVEVLLRHSSPATRRTNASIGAAVAAHVGDLSILECLLEQAENGAEVKARHMLMISIALSQQNDDIMRLLIRKGADIDCVDHNGKGLLQAVVDKRDVGQVNRLLQHGARPAGAAQLQTIWALAIAGGHAELTETLITTFRISVDTTVEGGRSALSAAVVFNKIEVVYVLLRHRANVNQGEQDQTALHFAAAGQDEMVRLLLDNGAHVNCEDGNGETPLHRATQRRSQSITRMLLDAGADPNAGSAAAKPLILAITLGTSNIAQMLLESGASVDGREYGGKTALEVAIEASRNETIPILERFGAGFNTVSVDTLIRVLEMNPKRSLGQEEKDMLTRLITAGVDVNGPSRRGTTPLITAINHADVETMRQLLAAGAKTSLRDSHGYPPLYFAIVREAPEFVTLLLEAGAQADQTDQNGQSAIEWAVELRELKENGVILDAILEKKPDLNRKIRGNPLLYRAIMTGKNAYTIQRLIEEGVDVTATIGGFRRTNALNWVELMGPCRAQNSIRQMLIQYGMQKV